MLDTETGFRLHETYRKGISSTQPICHDSSSSSSICVQPASPSPWYDKKPYLQQQLSFLQRIPSSYMLQLSCQEDGLFARRRSWTNWTYVRVVSFWQLLTSRVCEGPSLGTISNLHCFPVVTDILTICGLTQRTRFCYNLRKKLCIVGTFRFYNCTSYEQLLTKICSALTYKMSMCKTAFSYRITISLPGRLAQSWVRIDDSLDFWRSFHSKEGQTMFRLKWIYFIAVQSPPFLHEWIHRSLDNR